MIRLIQRQSFAADQEKNLYWTVYSQWNLPLVLIVAERSFYYHVRLKAHGIQDRHAVKRMFSSIDGALFDKQTPDYVLSCDACTFQRTQSTTVLLLN